MRRLPSPVLYVDQCLVPRITQGTHPTNVVLLLGEARLERRPLPGLQRPIEGTVGHRDRCVQAEHFGHVHGLARIVLLAVGLPHLRVRGHYDAGFGPVHPGLPRPLGAHHLAVFVLFGVLPEVPDGALVVLGEPVVGPFDQLAAFPFPVIDHDALHAHYLLGVGGDGHLAALCAPLVDEGGARLHREVLVVDRGGEVCGIDVGSVSLLLPLLRGGGRSEEHTSELQSRQYLVCRLLLEKNTTYCYSLRICVTLFPLPSTTLCCYILPSDLSALTFINCFIPVSLTFVFS